MKGTAEADIEEETVNGGVTQREENRKQSVWQWRKLQVEEENEMLSHGFMIMYSSGGSRMLETTEETCRGGIWTETDTVGHSDSDKNRTFYRHLGLVSGWKNSVRKGRVLVSLKPGKHRTRGESKVQLHGVVSSRKTTKQSSESWMDKDGSFSWSQSRVRSTASCWRPSAGERRKRKEFRIEVSADSAGTKLWSVH